MHASSGPSGGAATAPAQPARQRYLADFESKLRRTANEFMIQQRAPYVTVLNKLLPSALSTMDTTPPQDKRVEESISIIMQDFKRRLDDMPRSDVAEDVPISVRVYGPNCVVDFDVCASRLAVISDLCEMAHAELKNAEAQTGNNIAAAALPWRYRVLQAPVSAQKLPSDKRGEVKQSEAADVSLVRRIGGVKIQTAGAVARAEQPAFSTEGLDTPLIKTKLPSPCLIEVDMCPVHKRVASVGSAAAAAGAGVHAAVTAPSSSSGAEKARAPAAPAPASPARAEIKSQTNTLAAPAPASSAQAEVKSQTSAPAAGAQPALTAAPTAAKAAPAQSAARVLRPARPQANSGNMEPEVDAKRPDPEAEFATEAFRLYKDDKKKLMGALHMFQKDAEAIWRTMWRQEPDQIKRKYADRADEVWPLPVAPMKKEAAELPVQRLQMPGPSVVPAAVVPQSSAPARVPQLVKPEPVQNSVPNSATPPAETSSAESPSEDALSKSVLNVAANNQPVEGDGDDSSDENASVHEGDDYEGDDRADGASMGDDAPDNDSDLYRIIFDARIAPYEDLDPFREEEEDYPWPPRELGVSKILEQSAPEGGLGDLSAFRSRGEGAVAFSARDAFHAEADGPAADVPVIKTFDLGNRDGLLSSVSLEGRLSKSGNQEIVKSAVDEPSEAEILADIDEKADGSVSEESDILDEPPLFAFPSDLSASSMKHQAQMNEDLVVVSKIQKNSDGAT